MRDKIKNIMKSIFKLNEIPDDISQKNCSAWDSIHHLQLAIALETEFDISFDPDEIVEMKSIDDIERILKGYNFE